jgi:DNA replication protein DnaC
VLTTNKAFSEWTQVFAAASCVSALIDRIVHRAEIVKIDGDSYRQKESMARAERRAKERAAAKKKRRSS